MKIAQSLATCRPEVFELDLNEICEDLAPAGRGGFSRMRAALGSAPYKAARQQLRSIWASDGKPGDDALYQQAVAARDIVMEWSRLDDAGTPSAPADIAEREATYEHLLQSLAGLGAWVGSDGLPTMSTVDLQDLLLRLDGDRTTLANLPEIHRLERSLIAAGLEELLRELQRQQASEDFARKAFRHVWLHSVLDHVSLASALLAGFVAEKHERVADEFKAGDRLHLETTSARILRVCAEAAVKARDEFKDQAALVQRQAELKRRHLPVRDLVVVPEEVVHPGLLGGWLVSKPPVQGGHRMKLHANARLSVKGRELLVDRVEHAGWSVIRAAEAGGITERTAHKWLARYRSEGTAGLLDRSSAPLRVANRTDERRVEAIAALRRLRMTSAEIGEVLGMALSTVSGILTQIGMGKLGRLGLEPAQRYERQRPGELIHIDVKKLGRIHQGAGHRITGKRGRYKPQRTDAEGRVRKTVGWEFVHIAIDDATRLVYVEVFPDEKALTAIAFLRRAVAHYKSYGLTVEQLLTDG
jgi:transposase